MKNFDLLRLLVAGLKKSGIQAKKADHFAAPRTDAASEGFEHNVQRGAESAPVPAENIAQPRDDGVRLLFSGEDGVGQHMDGRGIEHVFRRRTAPTSLALHEHVCAVAQSRSCAELPVFHDAPGYPWRSR